MSTKAFSTTISASHTAVRQTAKTSRFNPGPSTTMKESARVARPKQSHIQVRMIDNEEEQEMVYRFRYGIYVEELHRAEPHADHERKRIEEPLDQDGVLFGAFRGDEMVGTLRMNSGESVRGYYEDLYGMSAYAPYFPYRTSITTKLMILPSLRRSSLSFRLAEAGFCYAHEMNFEHDFIDCNQHLKTYFLKLGYQQHMSDVEHPIYGHVSRLRLDLNDWAHLMDVRSPFCRLRLKRQTLASPCPRITS